MQFVRKLKSADGVNADEHAAKNKTGTTLRITKKNFQDEEKPHELLLTTRQITKITSTFANNFSIVIKLSKVQLS